jgi:glycosyltransferase involved in cell wall biosynthesis
MSKPSVLFINRVYPPDRGATGRLVEDLSAALEKSGWKVTILTTGEKEGLEFSGNITVQRVKSAKQYKTAFGYILSWFRLLFAALKVKKHDVVITLTDPPLLIYIGRLLSRTKNMHHVHWCQDLYPDLFKILNIKLPPFFLNFLQRYSRRCMNKASNVVVVGQCMGKYLAATGVQTGKITMIANWADLEVVAPSSPKGKYDYENMTVSGKSRRPEEMFRDDSPKFRVLYAGNIGRAHPMRSVIEAASILSKHTEIEFVFVGDKHVHSILARERGKRALENIKFMPYQPIERLHDVMESGDVHLVTMRNDAKGMLVPCKFYSGLTVGRPTVFVGPADCEVGNIIKNYNAGKIVPVGDAQALADAIYSYRMDGDAWFQAQEGALRAAQAYHPNQSLHKWLDLLEQVRISG